MPRIAPITSQADVSAEYHHVVDDAVRTFGHLRGPFGMLLHSPALAQHLLGIVHFNRDGSVLERRHRSLASLTAASEGNGHYVWSLQVKSARKAGVSEETIELIRAKGDPAALPEEERQVVSFVQQFMRQRNVDRATFDALHQRYGSRWLVELTVAAGFFGMLCGLVTTFEVPVPEGEERLR